MANVKVTLNYPIHDGLSVTFKAPCDCTAVEGLIIYYPELTENASSEVSKVFAFKDSQGNTLAGLGNLFSQGSYVKAILDTVNNYAYLQNANTNGYLESAKVDKSEIFDLIYPVGSIYMSVNGANPSTIFTGTTWVSWGSGRVPVGVNADNTNFNTVEKTGGAETHTLTTAQLPSHSHDTQGWKYTFSGNSCATIKTKTGADYHGEANGSISYTRVTEDKKSSQYGTTPILETGSGQAHNNLQPYITCYMWKRTA